MLATISTVFVSIWDHSRTLPAIHSIDERDSLATKPVRRIRWGARIGAWHATIFLQAIALYNTLASDPHTEYGIDLSKGSDRRAGTIFDIEVE